VGWHTLLLRQSLTLIAGGVATGAQDDDSYRAGAEDDDYLIRRGDWVAVDAWARAEVVEGGAGRGGAEEACRSWWSERIAPMSVMSSGAGA
jgi:hypothetical protein